MAAEQLQPEEVDASLAEWLVTQRAAWGEGRLDLEQKLLLQLAGIRSRVQPVSPARPIVGRAVSSESCSAAQTHAPRAPELGDTGAVALARRGLPGPESAVSIFAAHTSCLSAKG